MEREEKAQWIYEKQDILLTGNTSNLLEVNLDIS